jgi:hypothetical protein
LLSPSGRHSRFRRHSHRAFAPKPVVPPQTRVVDHYFDEESSESCPTMVFAMEMRRSRRCGVPPRAVRLCTGACKRSSACPSHLGPKLSCPSHLGPKLSCPSSKSNQDTLNGEYWYASFVVTTLQVSVFQTFKTPLVLKKVWRVGR